MRCLVVSMLAKEVVREQLKAFSKMEKEFQADPREAKRFLIRAGILDKSGKRLARRYRANGRG